MHCGDSFLTEWLRGAIRNLFFDIAIHGMHPITFVVWDFGAIRKFCLSANGTVLMLT